MLEGLIAEYILAQIDLYPPFTILQMDKGRAAEMPDGHDAARAAHGLLEALQGLCRSGHRTAR